MERTETSSAGQKPGGSRGRLPHFLQFSTSSTDFVKSRIAGSLQALLTRVIDYAGLYPPAGLPLPIVAERYGSFLASPDAWMLNRLVLPLADLAKIERRDGWRITLLVQDEPGPLPPQVETLEIKRATRLSLPTYCEAPLEEIHDAFAKVRTGGLTPEAIPKSSALAQFLCEAAERHIPFKATAGLHHPLRAEYALTYAIDSPRALMHGFVNVFAAACFAWHGMKCDRLAEVLDETDADAFEFGDDTMAWRENRLTALQIQKARREFAHSFGSCSFEEPVSSLRNLGLIP